MWQNRHRANIRGFVLERSAADRTNKNVTERQNGAISRQKQYKLLSRLLAERPRASLNDQHQIERTNNQSSTSPLLAYGLEDFDRYIVRQRTMRFMSFIRQFALTLGWFQGILSSGNQPAMLIVAPIGAFGHITAWATPWQYFSSFGTCLIGGSSTANHGLIGLWIGIFLRKFVHLGPFFGVFLL